MAEKRNRSVVIGQASGLYRLVNALKLLFMLTVVTFFLYGIVSTYAFVIYLEEDTVDDFLNGVFYFAGLSSKDDTVTLLPIGITGNWEKLITPLPDARTDLAAVATNNRIFAIGGFTFTGSIATSYRTEIYSTTVTEPYTGTINGWTKIGDLPVGLAGHSAVLHPTTAQTSTLFILGGTRYISPNEVSVDTIYRGVINNATGGLVGSIEELSSPTLPESMRYLSAVLRGDTLYVIGGARLEPYFDATWDMVHKASISPSGVLGDFSETTALPKPIRSAAAVLYSGTATDTIYVMGGTIVPTQTFDAKPVNAVLFGDINPDTGEVVSWTDSLAGALSAPVWGHTGAIVNGGALFVMGGRTDLEGNVVVSSTVQSAMVDENDDARILNWCGVPDCDRWQSQQGENLLANRSEGASVVVGYFMYYMGGADENNLERREVYRSAVGGLGGMEREYYYAPSGYYQSRNIDLDAPNPYDRNQVKGLSWRAYLTGTNAMSVTMKYRYWDFGATPPTTWSVATPSQSQNDGGGYSIYTATIDSVYTDTRYFQYRTEMRTISHTLTPRLDWVRVYYDVPDPEVAVSKSGPAGIYPKETVSYTIHYTASGGVPSHDVVMTETVPRYTSYVTSAGWSPTSGGVYTYYLGTRGTTGSGMETGSVSFNVTADEGAAAHASAVTNVVEINYPPVRDSWGNLISDPITSDNVFTYVIPIYKISWDATKSATPYPEVELGSQRSMITYTIRYTYTGQHAETGSVWISDTLDNRLEVISYSPGAQRIGRALLWERDASQFAPNQSDVVTFTAWVTRPLDNGTRIGNRTFISSEHAAPRPSPWVTHTVVSTPTLSIHKSSMPVSGSYVMPRSVIQYTITVTNTGGMNASSVVITDTVDTNYLEILSYPGGELIGENTLKWPAHAPLSKLVVDTPWVVTFTARISSVHGVTIENQTQVDCAERPPLSSNVVTHYVPDLPVLQIDKDDGLTEVQPGQVFTYQVSFNNTNPGSVPVPGVRITDTYPASVLRPVDAGSVWQNCGDGCRYYTYAETLTQSVVTIPFAVQVLPTAPLGPFVNQVAIVGGADAIPSSDTDQDVVVLKPNVTIAKSSNQSVVMPGEYITYNIEYQNPDERNYDFVLTDTLPAELRYVGYGWQPIDDHTYTRTLRFSAGPTQTLHLFAQVDPGAPPGALTNTVIMGGGPYVQFQRGISATDETTIGALRDLAIDKTDGIGVVRPGQNIVYTIHYTNVGNVTMTNVRITDTLETNLNYVDGTCGWTGSASSYVANLGTLVGGQSGECKLTAKVKSSALSGAYTENVVSIGGSEGDDDWSNNTFTDTNYVTTADTAVDLYLVTIASNPITPTVAQAADLSVKVYSQTVEIMELDLPENEIVIGEFHLPRPPNVGEMGAQDYCDSWNEWVLVAVYVDPYKEPRYPDDTWYTYVGLLRWPFAGNSASVSLWAHGDEWLPSVSHTFMTSGWHKVYAQADMWDRDLKDCPQWKRSYGHLPEANELNNIGSLNIYVAPSADPGEAGGVFLPFIVKNK